MTSKQQIQTFDPSYVRPEIDPRRRPLQKFVEYGALPIIVTGMLMVTSANTNSFIQVIIAFLLLVIPWAAYRNWQNSDEYGLPIFSIIAALHWLYFAVALFWGDRLAPVWYSNTSILSEDDITKALLTVLLGVVAIGIGMKSRLAKSLIPKTRIPLMMNGSKWNYVRLLLIAGSLASFFPNAVYIFGEAGRQWILAFQTAVPLLAALLLLRRYFRGSAADIDRLLILAYIVVRVVTGLGSGWSGSVFYLGVAVGLVYLLERRTIPFSALTLVLLVAIFLQPGKSEFRRTFWYSDNDQADLFGRISYWLDRSLQSWEAALNDPTGQQLNTYLRGSMLRVSLLNQAANVHEKTPDVVPYQQGQLYMFSVAGLVPRFLWPDKPTGNDANRFYQVVYGITTEDRLDDVSIAIGYMTEAFISFGWFGVAGVMFLLGVVYDALRTFFFRNADNELLIGIGILAVVQLLRIETQLGLYLVSTIQAFIVGLLVSLPIIIADPREIQRSTQS